ncbi:MAG: LuxR family transcriptional regulator [Methylobacterium sp.]|jgi:LuxR family transcriptional regulator, quorum-sensing system regulator BjaR1|nr:MAG: LuxR family transcriptional regulator [Methylobacterium sp.]
MKHVPQSASDIVARLRGATRLEDILSELKSSGRIFGYDTFLMGRLPVTDAKPPRLRGALRLAPRMAASLSGRAFRPHRSRHPAHPAQRRPIPLARGPRWAGRHEGQSVLEEARAFGLVEGFCVPLHQVGGGESGLSFGGERLAPSEDERAALHLIGIYALSAARAILRRTADSDDELPAPAHLTEREVECLKWSAAGKTAWEISVILSISRRTVEQYLASAARKLDAVSRVQSVAEALRRGIID